MGCRRRAGSHQLIRFAERGGGLIEGAGQPGRGAWLCRERLIECFDRATETRAWARSLRTRVDDESLASLRAQLLDSFEG